ncbi:hypothetical protein LINPERHAP1_LOCUS13851 [Linum perenne]
MLARCFCIPLVSVRVGKLNKQWNLFCPTSARGGLKISCLLVVCLFKEHNADDAVSIAGI